MINIKPDIYNALVSVIDNVHDGYPSSFIDFPVVAYCEEENKTYIKTDDKERIAYVRYKIDIWSNKSTSNLAIDIDNAISSFGLKRTQCVDIAEKDLKHKVLRYEGYIDVNKLRIYN